MCRVQGSGFRVQGSGFRVQGSGFRLQGSGFRVQGSGFRIQGGALLPFLGSGGSFLDSRRQPTPKAHPYHDMAAPSLYPKP